MDLDFMPSPVEDRPGLLIRDSRGYSDVTLIIPPPLVNCLSVFDGEQTDLDLRAKLVEITGELAVGDLQSQITDTLREAGFLHDETFESLRAAKHTEFATASTRTAAHAGSAYPEDRDELEKEISSGLSRGLAGTSSNLAGIAAPHVSPFGGWESYKEAYRHLSVDPEERTFVILGTSHHGEPGKFGLTRKPFSTPFGSAQTDVALVDELSGQPAVLMEDYHHAVEHSIEFQIIFLQYLFGPSVRILPVLCGSFAKSIYYGGKPEDDEDIRRFFGKLGEMQAREGSKLSWVLGIDMAHMGVRYGDAFAATAGEGEMEQVAARDLQRIERIVEGDADGFWGLVQEQQDDLKWCGSAPLYTFMKAMPSARGTVARYDQWNIDEESVVSFAAIAFNR
jgi:AmmeMemoRadiSam system protein B